MIFKVRSKTYLAVRDCVVSLMMTQKGRNSILVILVIYDSILGRVGVQSMNAILLALLVLLVAVALVGRVRAARTVAAAAVRVALYEEAAASSKRRFEKEAMRRNHGLYLAKEARVASQRSLLEALARAEYPEAFRGHPRDLVLLQAPGRKTWILRSDLRDQVLDMIEEDLAS